MTLFSALEVMLFSGVSYPGGEWSSSYIELELRLVPGLAGRGGGGDIEVLSILAYLGSPPPCIAPPLDVES